MRLDAKTIIFSVSLFSGGRVGRLVSEWLDGRHSGKVHRKMFAPGDLILDARGSRFISFESKNFRRVGRSAGDDDCAGHAAQRIEDTPIRETC